MGWCKLPGRDWEPGWTSEGCAAAGGQYSETGPGNGCFVTTILTRSLSQANLDLGQTYQYQIAFRDEVLASSPVGKRMIKIYYKYNPTILSIVLRNYELLAESMKTWMSILDFVTATVIAAGRSGDVPEEHRRLRFSKALHDRIVRLLDRLRAGSEDKGFHGALDEVKEELSPVRRPDAPRGPAALAQARTRVAEEELGRTIISTSSLQNEGVWHHGLESGGIRANEQGRLDQTFF